MKIPSGETLWVIYCVGGIKRWVVTSKQARDYYFLYKVNGESLEKVGKARTPSELEEKYLKDWLGG